MKIKEELGAQKSEIEKLNSQPFCLSEEKLMQVAGGTDSGIGPWPDSPDVIFQRALSLLGQPYLYGGAGPEGYDAIGLVSYCVTGIHATTRSIELLKSWPQVRNPVPGDICVSHRHCGIYNGPGSMIHISNFGGMVVSLGAIQGDMIIVRPTV